MQEADILRISLSLVLIVGLIFASAWVAKRGGLLRHKSAQRIEILSSQRVGPRANLMLVQIGKQQLLLGVTPQQINTLHTLSDVDIAHSSDPNTASAHSAPSSSPLNTIPEAEQSRSALSSFKQFLQRSQSTQHHGSR
ncbi:MAG TPA: flagellar biosynthetic protein FliO [Paenalcaligenes sp.]|nr:flagellar biosynthetic protein FliO [Paenalcaligenes sp.]